MSWVLAVILVVKLNGAIVSVHTQAAAHFSTVTACDDAGRAQLAKFAPPPKDDPAELQVGWYCAKADDAHQ